MSMTLDICPFDSKYAEEISSIIIDNLKSVDIKDYGDEIVSHMCPFYVPQKLVEYAQNEEIYVAKNGPEIVGTISLSESQVRNVYVKIGYQKQGIGKELISFIENAAKAKNMKGLYLFSNCSAVEFYNKIGFLSLLVINKNLNSSTMQLTLMAKNI